MSEKKVNYAFLTKEIIATTPKWIVRWGITVILLTFISLGTILSLIEYPISVVTQATLEYEVKPSQLTIFENSVLAKLDCKDGSFVWKGAPILHVESIQNKTKYPLDAPTSGTIHLTDKWIVNSYLKKGDVFGFIIPSPNQRIIKVSLSLEESSKIIVGQNVVIKMYNSPNINLVLQGYVDYVGPLSSKNKTLVNIKFSSSVNSALISNQALSKLNIVNCTAEIIIDNTTYLKHLFHL